MGTRIVAVGLFALPLLLGACGDDDGAGVASASGSASGSGSASASGSGSGSAHGGSPACSPVGEELEGDAAERVEVQLGDFAFVPSTIEVEAGTVTFVADNRGEHPHELAFLPGGGDVPLTDDGAPDEAALERAGAFELEAFAPGETCNATFELEAGTYTIFCLVEDEGETHYDKGMRGSVTVG